VTKPTTCIVHVQNMNILNELD